MIRNESAFILVVILLNHIISINIFYILITRVVWDFLVADKSVLTPDAYAQLITSSKNFNIETIIFVPIGL